MIGVELFSVAAGWMALFRIGAAPKYPTIEAADLLATLAMVATVLAVGDRSVMLATALGAAAFFLARWVRGSHLHYPALDPGGDRAMMALTIDDPAYFARLARAESGHWWHPAMWRIASGWLDGALRGKRDLVALDVGCGAGGTMGRLADRPEIGRVLGVDPSPTAVALSGCRGAVLGSALTLPFATHSIAVVTCFDVLQHLEPGEDLIAMREIGRVLRPGGVAVVRANGAGLWPDASRAETPYRLSVLADLARSAGLAVRRASYANALPSVATEILGRVTSKASEAVVGRFERVSHGHPQGRGLAHSPSA